VFRRRPEGHGPPARNKGHRHHTEPKAPRSTSAQGGMRLDSGGFGENPGPRVCAACPSNRSQNPGKLWSKTERKMPQSRVKSACTLQITCQSQGVRNFSFRKTPQSRGRWSRAIRKMPQSRVKSACTIQIACQHRGRRNVSFQKILHTQGRGHFSFCFGPRSRVRGRVLFRFRRDPRG
jgi:hypothetical protein